VRLIDADKLKLEIIKSHEYHGDTSELISALERDIRIIDEQPTDYDVDKVVEELESWRDIPMCNNRSRFEAFDIAIDIVKRGEINGIKTD
jgi:hypothetical protein